MYFEYGQEEIKYLKSRDKKLAAAIEKTEKPNIYQISREK